MVVGLDLAMMMEKDMEVVEELWMKLVKERVHQEAECTVDEKEQDAARCQEVVSSIPNARATSLSICVMSKRCWNAHINGRREVVGREKRA
jgi:hypothetical protein